MNDEIIASLFVDLTAISEVVGNQFITLILIALNFVGRGVVDLGTNFSFWQGVFIQRYASCVVNVRNLSRYKDWVIAVDNRFLQISLTRNYRHRRYRRLINVVKAQRLWIS